MGNMRRLDMGEDFSAKDFAQEKDFGFTGSAQGYDEHPVAPPFAGSKPTDNGENFQNYAEGGKVDGVGGSAGSFAKGGKAGHEHPHGHQVVRVHHDPHSGAVIHHHAHGGYTMHHPDGSMTHHGADGQPAMARGGQMMPGGHSQEGTHVGKMRHKPAMDTAPRNAARNPSTRNAMPGGEMPMGVEPSAEPDEPDGDEGGSGGAPMMARGGRHRG